MGLPIIGMVLQVAGSFVQASMTAKAAKYEAQVENEKLKIEMENERIKSMQEQSARQEEFLRNESANRVAIAVNSGGGRNYGYEQGLGVYNKTVAVRDIQNIDFNANQSIGMKGYQISVNKWGAKVKAKTAWTEAIIGGLSTIGGYMARPGGLQA